ncbi:MAG: hypothetical protein N3D81_02735 [Spirochaetes bacterium]|nr:hypothetical protein [Spirochaetota bacterium]
MSLIKAFAITVILLLPIYSQSQVSSSLQITNSQRTNGQVTNQNVVKQELKKDVEIKARVEFFNKKSIDGKVVFKTSNVVMNHVDKNVEITLDTPYTSIEYIHPVTWFPEFSKIDKDGKIMYNFYPIEYVVKLKDGKYLNVVGRVSSFEVIDFIHKYGKSKIYTYYVDYLVANKKGETKWKNMGTYELNKNFKKPHPNVAYYIYFID